MEKQPATEKTKALAEAKQKEAQLRAAAKATEAQRTASPAVLTVCDRTEQVETSYIGQSGKNRLFKNNN